MPRTRLYRDGVMVAEDFPLEQVRDHVGDPSAMIWVHLASPPARDLAKISDELDLHPLAVEDVLQKGQRPKLDLYPTHQFITSYAAVLNAHDGRLSTTEVAAFVTSRALVTISLDHGFDIERVVRRWDNQPDLARFGVPYLLHGLLDTVVDTHFDAVADLDELIDTLEEQLFADSPADPQIQRRTYQLRKSLVTLRRVVLPMREVVDQLRRVQATADEAMVPYFQDVYDHVLRAGEWTDTLREMVATIMETQLTQRGNRLNVVMKKVTSWAAIIAVPTAITGFYGQNLPYPGFGQWSGFVTSSILIALTSVSLYIAFRAKDWL